MTESNGSKTSWGSVEKLNDLNYQDWKVSIRDQLKLAKFWKYTSQAAPATNATPKERAKFAEENDEACALIRTRMEKRALALVKDHDNLSAAWKLLETSFKHKGSGILAGRITTLLYKITLSSNDNNTTEYANAFRDAVASIEQVSGNQVLDDNLLIVVFHEGLGPDYQSYRENYVQTHEALNEEGKPAYTIEYALQRFANTCATGEKLTIDTPAVTLAAVKKPGSTRMVEIKYCTHCKKDFHTADECRLLHPELPSINKRGRDNNSSNRGKRHRGRGGNNNSGSSSRNNNNSGDQQGQQANNQLNQSNQSNNSAYISLDTEPTTYTFAIANSGLGLDVWALDSACSQHTICNKAAFIPSSYTEFPSPRPITGLAGSIQAVGSGTVVLNCNVKGRCARISFTNAIHVPQAPLNLISYGQLHGICPINTAPWGFEIGPDRIPAVKQKNNLFVIELWKPKDTTPTSSFSHAVFSSVNRDTLNVWHNRLGHLGDQNVRRLANMADGIDLTKSIQTKEPCEPCVMANTRAKPHNRPAKPGRFENDYVYSDLTGPLPDNKGIKYLVTFTDDYTKASEVYLLKRKSETFNAFQRYKLHVEHGQNRIHRLRTDYGGEYVKGAFDDFRKELGINWEPTVPGTPEQNGAAERLGQTLMHKVCAMLMDTGLDRKWWTELVVTANYLRNRSPVAGRSMTPYEAQTGIKPDLSNLRAIGTYGHAMKRKPATGWKKLQERAILGRLIGYTGHSMYKMLLPDNTIYVTDNVVWQPEKRKQLLSTAAPQTIMNPPVPKMPKRETQNPTTVVPLIRTVAANLYLQNQLDQSKQLARSSGTYIPQSTLPNSPRFTEVQDDSESPRSPSPPPRLRYSLRQTMRDYPMLRQRGDSPDPISLIAYAAAKDPEALLAMASLTLAQPYEPYEPKTLAEAQQDAFWEQWEKGMKDENNSLNQNNTWELVPLPTNRKALRGKWVFKIKRGANGEILRYKARWVVRGFEQQEGLDYHETFASVVKPMSQKALFAIAAAKDWELDQMDIKTAFLYGIVDEEIYVEQPTHLGDGSGRVCKLKRALYGLKQSPRIWYQTLASKLLKWGYKPLDSECNVFVNGSTYVAVYVDDLLITGPNRDNINALKQMLSQEFEMSDLGPCAYYLGLQIIRDRPNRTLSLNQTTYIKKVLEDHGMEDCKPLATPMDPKHELKKPEDNYEATAAFRKQYQSAVGSLMYIMLGTRPDIAYAISVVSRYGSNPTESHWAAVKRIFRYLQGTADLKMIFKGPIDRLFGFTDSDWAGDKDTRRSTSGYVFSLGSAPISWQSKRQATVALSTCEAEYIGQTQAAKEAIWLKSLLVSLTNKDCFPGAVMIYGDNQGAIALAKNPQFHARSKHIDIQNHFVREAVADGKVSLAYVPTAEQVADGLTKPLARDKFETFRRMLCIM